MTWWRDPVMPDRRRPAAPGLWLLLAAVLLALPVYGWSSATLKLLGPAHRHQAATARPLPAADGDSLLAALLGPRTAAAVRAWQQRIDTMAGLHAPAVRLRTSHAEHTPTAAAHFHGLFERHHHDAADTTVVKATADDHGRDAATDAATEAADEAASGSGALPLLAGLMPPWPAPAGRRRPWPRLQPAAWRDGLHGRLDRPPSGR